MIINLNTIKSYFLTGFKPLEQQFFNVWDSYRHKLDPIPISDVDGLQNQLNTLYNNQQTGVIPNSETQIVNGDFSKAFAQGKVLESILIDPTGTFAYVINIGTEPGGSDIVEGFVVDALEPDQFFYSKYFKTAATWYFTGVAANSTVTFFYK